MFLRIFAILLLLIALNPLTLKATPQMPNWLTFEGKDYPIDGDPMWNYFEKFPDKRPKTDSRMSALWRGYVAFFEFRANNLFLKDLRVWDGMRKEGEYYFEQWKSVITESLGGAMDLNIDWCSELLVAGYGENTHPDPYDIFEFKKSYQRYAIFEIDSGRLTDKRFFDNKGFRAFFKQQSEAFKKTKEFQTLVEKGTAEGGTRKGVEEVVDDWVFVYSNKILTK